VAVRNVDAQSNRSVCSRSFILDAAGPKAKTLCFTSPPGRDPRPNWSAKFLLHLHRAAPVNNPTLITIKVNASQKRVIRDELHRLDINQFTTYYDLDHLSKEIRRGWSC
jgi:hypothetical protein